MKINHGDHHLPLHWLCILHCIILIRGHEHNTLGSKKVNLVFLPCEVVPFNSDLSVLVTHVIKFIPKRVAFHLTKFPPITFFIIVWTFSWLYNHLVMRFALLMTDSWSIKSPIVFNIRLMVWVRHDCHAMQLFFWSPGMQ
jgi:hypothetical protein